MQIFPAQYRKCHKLGWKLLLTKYQIYLFPNIKVYLDARIFTAFVWRFAPSVLQTTNQERETLKFLSARNCHINWSPVLFYKLSQLCHQETPLLPGPRVAVEGTLSCHYTEFLHFPSRSRRLFFPCVSESTASVWLMSSLTKSKIGPNKIKCSHSALE